MNVAGKLFDGDGLERLRLLTARRMTELGIRTYREFSEQSGISEGVVRRVMAKGGGKNVGVSLWSRWAGGLKLSDEERDNAASWVRGQTTVPGGEAQDPDDVQ